MAKVEVSITGMDDVLVRLTGQFNAGMDERLLGRSSVFIRELDKASSKVFKAMATTTIVGTVRAHTVIGTHHNQPAFLSPYIPSGEEWEPLSAAYLKRKKRLLQNHKKTKTKADLARVTTTAFWQYKGELKRFFQQNSQHLSRMSNNSLRYKPPTWRSNGENMFTDDVIRINNLSLRGGSVSTRADQYDFKYVGESVTPVVTYTNKNPRAGLTASRRAVSQMRRYVEFDLFGGLSKYLAALDGKGSVPSPEDYIAEISFGAKAGDVMKNGDYRFETLTSGGMSNRTIGQKLYYKKHGMVKKRALIQPYMQYYANKVLKPFALKLLKEGKY